MIIKSQTEMNPPVGGWRETKDKVAQRRKSPQRKKYDILPWPLLN